MTDLNRWGATLIFVWGSLLGCSGTTVDAPNTSCYSPTQNASRAYAPGAQGCSCDPAVDRDVCVQGAALMCIEGRWSAVEDGPCAPQPVPCAGGTIVKTRADCVTDSATCEPLPDGTFCTRPAPGQCPAPSIPVEPGPACPKGYVCTTYSQSITCQTKKYTIDECKAAGGIPTPDRGDGSLTPSRCPNGTALGSIDASWAEGGLCCAGPAPATPRACGARAGDTCSSSEFCAYEPPELCGQADAEAVCKPRPSPTCVELYAPVCGCDGKTYDNSCFANAAGTGIYASGECATH